MADLRFLNKSLTRDLGFDIASVAEHFILQIWVFHGH